MSASTNNGPFWWADDGEDSAHHVSIIDNPSSSESPWTTEPPRESYASAHVETSTSSWPSIGTPDTPFLASVHGMGGWSGNQWPDAYHCPFFSPDGLADAQGTNFFTGMEMATPVLQPTLSVTQRALPASAPPPFVYWAQASEPSPEIVSPQYYAVRASSMHHIAHSISADSFGVGPEISRFRLAASSAITGPSGRTVMPTGHLSSVPAPHSVRPLQSDPVPVPPCILQPRAGRLDLSSNTTSTFPCLWSSGSTRCTGVVAGDRRSVTSHLRDEHDFTGDGVAIVCAWDACTARMQRRNIPRHIVACHLEIKVPCEWCGMLLSRADAGRKHRLACPCNAAARGVMEGSEQDNGRLFFSGVDAPRIG